MGYVQKGEKNSSFEETDFLGAMPQALDLLFV